MGFKINKIRWNESKNGVFVGYELDIAIHPLNNGKIVINFPGANGSINGYNDKYVKIAQYLVDQRIGAVVRIPNIISLGYDWENNLRKTLSYALEQSRDICGSSKPEIYLMGTSAGAGTIALLAWEYPQVTKILLTEPAIVFNRDLTLSSMAKFKGKVVIVTGSGSNALGIVVGKKFYDGFVNAKEKEIFEIPDCDHQFRGEINGRIFSQAPVYAFSEKKIKFSQQNGGIKLYD